MRPPAEGFGPLRGRLDEAAQETGLHLNDLTVLAVESDPFRQDTATARADGRWHPSRNHCSPPTSGHFVIISANSKGRSEQNAHAELKRHARRWQQQPSSPSTDDNSDSTIPSLAGRVLEHDILNHLERIAFETEGDPAVTFVPAIHKQGDSAWASPSAKPQIGRDGTHIKKDGKPQYSPVVSFASKELRDKFSDTILDALRSSHPEALAP
jgi:hypothetical protein